eukprot:CAMPEP_0182447550 /NCGR_PEP_ID=MMETSP1172-20130603/17352_1 /TAXON_ID=708627 /ORGANISM="Timspurckia oligopyrenoides, Strain CCMP3278" /LENGTH=154 /DNA_ID=CAMNT_0024644033 /DNA_START=174 /DNA_END=635 /DNA_ORIENTATION=-
MIQKGDCRTSTSRMNRVAIASLLCSEEPDEDEIDVVKVDDTLNTLYKNHEGNCQKASETIIHHEEQLQQEEEQRRRPRSTWSVEEDEVLTSLVEKYGTKSWSMFARKHFNGLRNAGALRSRYNNNLLPDRECRPWLSEEDRVIIDAHVEFGNCW